MSYTVEDFVALCATLLAISSFQAYYVQLSLLANSRDPPWVVLVSFCVEVFATLGCSLRLVGLLPDCFTPLNASGGS